MTESVGWQREEHRHPAIPTVELMRLIGKGPGVLGDIGGLFLSSLAEVRKTSEWTHVLASKDPQVISDAQRLGMRFFYEREPWDLPFGSKYLKAAVLKLPDGQREVRVKQSLGELARVLQPEGAVVVSTAWGGLQRTRLSRLLERHHFEVTSVLQVRNGVVGEACNTDDPIVAVARLKWRPWMS